MKARVLLRRHNRLYSAGPKMWVSSPDEAMDFGTVREAIAFFQDSDLGDAELFFSYGTTQLDASFPLDCSAKRDGKLEPRRPAPNKPTASVTSQVSGAQSLQLGLRG